MTDETKMLSDDGRKVRRVIQDLCASSRCNVAQIAPGGPLSRTGYALASAEAWDVLQRDYHRWAHEGGPWTAALAAAAAGGEAAVRRMIDHA